MLLADMPCRRCDYFLYAADDVSDFRFSDRCCADAFAATLAAMRRYYATVFRRATPPLILRFRRIRSAYAAHDAAAARLLLECQLMIRRYEAVHNE